MNSRSITATSTQITRRVPPPPSVVVRRDSSPVGRDLGCSTAGPPTFTLRLRAKKVVKWGEDVVDNEDMGKRKSKKCCIFHKRKKFGESSSESEGYSSGAESGSESPGRQRRALCTCDDGENSGSSGPVRAGAKRGVFTQRRQEQEPATPPQNEARSWDGPAAASSSPDTARTGGSGAAAGLTDTVASAEEATPASHLRDLLTDAAAVDRLQAENRPPPQADKP